MKLPVTPAEKLLTFVLLLALFIALAWPDLDHRRVQRLIPFFALGAGFALWAGREQISIFRPTTLAAYWVLFGSLMMAWSCVMLLIIRFR